MKKVLFIIALLIFNVVSGQDEITSFYFGEPVNAGNDYEENFPKEIVGKYQNSNDSTARLEITEDTIFFSHIEFMTLTRQELDANKNWSVDDEFVYGIIEGEKVPYVESNDTLYFALPLNSPLSVVSEDRVGRDGSSLLIFKEIENGYWSLMKLDIYEDSLTIGSFDHELVLEEILGWRDIEDKMMDGIKTYIGVPSKKRVESDFEKRKGI